MKRTARPLFPSYSSYTELNEDCESIFLATKGRVSFRRLSPICKDHKKRDPSKYCCYHKDIRHETNDCTTLKDEIEELIQLSHFRRFLGRQSCEKHTHEDCKSRHHQRDSGYNNHIYHWHDYLNHGRCDQRSPKHEQRSPRHGQCGKPGARRERGSKQDLPPKVQGEINTIFGGLHIARTSRHN